MEIESDSKKDTKIILEKSREIGSFLLPKIRKEGIGWLDGSRVSPLRSAAIPPNYRQPLKTAAVKTAADFDSAMSRAAAVSGAAGSDLEA